MRILILSCLMLMNVILLQSFYHRYSHAHRYVYHNNYKSCNYQEKLTTFQTNSVLFSSLQDITMADSTDDVNIIPSIIINERTSIKQRLYTTDNNNNNNNYNSTSVEKSLLEKRTLTCLDFQIIIDYLRSNTKTTLGSYTCDQYDSINHNIITSNYAKVNQISSFIIMIPLYSKLNIWPLINAIENNTLSPTREDLARFSFDVDQIVEIHKYFNDNIDKFNLFTNIIKQIKLSLDLINMFHLSFKSSNDNSNNNNNHGSSSNSNGQDEYELNIDKYPTIKLLKSQINSLKMRIVSTLQSLLQSIEMRDKIADK